MHIGPNWIVVVCAESTVNLLPGWKPSTYLDFWGRFTYSTSTFQRHSFTNKGCLLMKSSMWRSFWGNFLVQNSAGSRGDPVFAFPGPDLPIQYIIFTGLRWRLRAVYWWVMTGEHRQCQCLLEPKFSKSRQKMSQKGFWGNGVMCKMCKILF